MRARRCARILSSQDEKIRDKSEGNVFRLLCGTDKKRRNSNSFVDPSERARRNPSFYFHFSRDFNEISSVSLTLVIAGERTEARHYLNEATRRGV